MPGASDDDRAGDRPLAAADQGRRQGWRIMTDPVRERQLQELDTVGICTRIFYQARSELYVNMHFLDIPLSSLGFEADWGRNGLAVDGAVIFYGPDAC